jgi:peptide/nickel transport system ATP-binding protein
VDGPAGPLISGLDLTVESGERLGIVGPSGSGKTLTAGALLGLPLPGLRVSGDRYLSPRTGALLQESASALNPLMRVGRQYDLALRGAGVPRAERRERIDRQLKELALDADTRRAWPLHLSGGQRQRAALGLALVTEPELVVADEPTAALDALTQNEILLMLRRILDARATALILISHDLALVARLCERVVVLGGGRIVEEGPTADILAEPQHPTSARLVDAARTLGVTA